jgi:kynurenine formamidase
MPRLIDLSHTVEEGMITYPGLPGPMICDFLSREASKKHYAEGTSFQIGRIDLVANTGTYVDSPFHRFENGADLAALPLDRLANLEAIVIDARDCGRRILGQLFDNIDVRGKAVLVRTGWDRHWRTPLYLRGHPYLSREIAQRLMEGGATLVGIDSLNIDDIEDGTRPVHTTLLGAGIPIAEHLCGLDGLPEDGFRFHAVPVKVRDFGTFPVRAYAVV